MHTVKRVCTLVLTGLLALPMAAPAGAAAASFSDLPSSHWAYIAMTEAAGYGILQGTGANTMSPSGTIRIDKNESVTVPYILSHLVGHDAAKRIKTLPHVCRIRVKIISVGFIQRKHRLTV